MAKKLETPCAAPRRGLPFELKYDFAIGGWTDAAHRGYLYTIREEYGAATALEIVKRVYTMGDRVKNLTNYIRTIFNLEGNDTETIGELFDIWDELTGVESTILERSKTINRRKVTTCPFKTDYIDVSDWVIFFFDIMTKTINPKATLEISKAMCVGDSYCEYIWKLEEINSPEEKVETMAKKLETPCAAPKRGIPAELKFEFSLNGHADFHKGTLYALREKYGSSETLELYDKVLKSGDRVKNFTKIIQKICNLKGNDCETIGEVLDVWDELCGYESAILERSPTINRRKVTKCPWKVKYKDIGTYAWYFKNQMGKGVNPRATLKMQKGMCKGDPYCEYVWKIED